MPNKTNNSRQTNRNIWTDAEKQAAVHRCVNLGMKSSAICKEMGVSTAAFSAWRVRLVGKGGDPKYASRCSLLNARIVKSQKAIQKLKDAVDQKLNDAAFDESIAAAMREPTPVIEYITPKPNGRDTDTPADSMEVLDIAIQVAAHTLKDLEQRKQILTQQRRITELEARLHETSVSG